MADDKAGERLALVQQKSDLVNKRANNINPLELLSLAASKADPELRKLASTITGFTQKLKVNADKVGAVNYTEKLKTAEEKYLEPERQMNTLSRDNALASEDLELAMQLAGIATDTQIAKKEQLDLEKLAIGAGQENLSLSKQIEQAEIKMASL